MTAMMAQKEIPRNMHLLEKEGSLQFEYTWFKRKYVFSLLAAPLFSYFLIQSNYIIGSFSQVTVPVIALILIGVFVFYYSLAKVINMTIIHVTQSDITVKHGPLPFLRNLALKKEDVTQFYVTQHRVGHRYYLFESTYQINVILKNKEIVTLVKGLHRSEQGRFIENKIESFLGITDIHVEGELAKD